MGAIALPSTYTSRVRYILQATGENINTWGGLLNTGVFQLVDDNVNGALAFALSGPKTLTTVNGATDEARMAILNITSGSGGTITIPPVSKRYDVRNASSGQAIITAGGVTATIEAGEVASVICDGTDVHRVRPTNYGSNRIQAVADPVNLQDVATKNYVDTTAFNGANLPGQGPATVNAYLKSNGVTAQWAFITVSEVTGAAPTASPTFTGGTTYSGSTKANVTAVGALDLDLSTADFFTKSIAVNSVFTFSNPTASTGMAFTLELTISGAAVPTWPANVDYAGGVNPSAGLGNGRHLLGFISYNGGTDWTMVVIARAAA